MRQDLRFALRTLLKRPGFTAVVVLTLALGIGVNAAIVSLVDGILLKPLPYRAPEELVRVWGADGATGQGRWWTSYPDLVDFEAESSAFVEMAAYRTPNVNLTGPEGDPERLDGATVSHDLMATLGIEPAHGRGFAPEDDAAGAERVAILSHGLWQRRFGADAGVLGRTVTVDGHAHTVIGVMPAGFGYPGATDLWLPLAHDAGKDSRGMHRLRVVARLVPGVAAEDAGSELARIARRLEEAYPETNTRRTAWVQPMHEAEVGGVRAALLVLFGAVALVLLIACVNVANLLLVRAADRSREAAVRAALGAGRWRLARQTLTESLILALAGGGLGMLFGAWLVRAVVASAPATVPRLGAVALDARVAAAMAAVTCLAALLFGLAPAVRAARVDLQPALREGPRLAGGGRHRLQQGLVVAEVALSVVLVIGAGLLIRSFSALTAVEPGFDAERLAAARLSLPEDAYSGPGKAAGFFDQLLEKVRALPGVTAAAAAYAHPLDGSWETSFQIEGVLERPEGQRPEARIRPVTPGYFQTVGVPLEQGRDFTARDGEDAPGVAVVNRAFVRAFLPPDVEPLGQRLIRGRWWPHLPGEYEIVGVVRDVRFDGLAAPAGPAMYYPHAQVPFTEMYLVLRTAEEAAGLAAAVRAKVWELDRSLPVDSLRPMNDVVAASVAEPRFNMLLLGLFAFLALTLAATGIYGVVSYAVARRTGELGVRQALGASKLDLLAMVFRQGLGLTAVGVAAGVLGAWWAVRLLASLLYGVSARDPWTFAAVALVLTTVAAAACYLPARRAVRVDPTEALRYE